MFGTLINYTQKMIFKLTKLFIYFLISNLFFCSDIKKTNPVAKSGVLDLSEWNFETDGTLLIEGDWEFFPVELLTHSDYQNKYKNSTREISYLNVPGVWNQFPLDKEEDPKLLGGLGYGTYHLKLKLPEIKEIGIKIPDQGTTYKIFIDDTFIVEGGKVGKTPEESFPDYNHFTKTFFITEREVDIYVQVSNFHYSKGGFWKSLEIGTPIAITKSRELSLALDLFICGALLIMGIYHLSLYSLRTVDKSTLWFGVMCILVFFRTIITGEYFLYDLYPNVNFNFAVKLEYISFYLALPIFVLFIRCLFVEFYKKFFRLSILFSLFYTIPVIFLESKIFTKFINLYQIVFLITIIYVLIILVKLSFHKNIDARIFLFGFFILTYTAINDILSANYIINSPYIGPLGLLFFIFSQSYLLSRRFSGSFLRAEALTKELKILSENLEHKVKDRTQELVSQKELTESALLKSVAAYKDLQEAQNQLIEAERMASLGQLVAGVAHEINNPIGVIKSNSEMLFKNLPLILENVPHYINSLSSSDKDIFFEQLKISEKKVKFLSTKEERALKKEIKGKLSIALTPNNKSIDLITEQILLLNLEDHFLSYLKALGDEKFLKSLELLQIYNNQKNYINNINYSVEKANRVIFALRTFLNTESFFNNKVVNLKNEIENSLHLYDNYIIGKINISKNYTDDLYFNCINENLTNVWKNIIFNAIQSMYNTDKNLHIRISLIKEIPDEFYKMKSTFIINDRISENTEKYILVSFIDSGIGIPERNQHKVFTPFFTTKPIGEGIGLGLYVSKKIVHEHKGEIFFKSLPGETEFHVVLPTE